MCSTENCSFHTVSRYSCIYILYVYTSVTVTKIRYVTVDALLYTQGENKTQKSCTVLTEGKDTHDCSKKVKENQQEGVIPS